MHSGENRRMAHRNAGTTIAAILWATAVQFFIAQAIVQLGWTTPFSLRDNFISDLGNTTCGPYPLDSAMYVCSPWHAWMNASFIVFGIQIVAGTVLFFRTVPFTFARTLGWALIFLAGPGVILVGIYPENGSIELHRLGAALNFVCGNLGMAAFGLATRSVEPWKRIWPFTTIAGVVGAVATVLFVEEIFLGLGIGGMERVAAYPLPIWMIVVGAWWLLRRAEEPIETPS